MQLNANNNNNNTSNSIRRCYNVGHDERDAASWRCASPTPTSSVSLPSSGLSLQSSLRLLSMNIWANDNLQNDFGCIIYADADAVTAASSQF